MTVIPVVPGSENDPEPDVDPMVTADCESISERSSLWGSPAASRVAFTVSATVEPGDVWIQMDQPFP